MKLNKWVRTSFSFGNAILVALIVLRMWTTTNTSESINTISNASIMLSPICVLTKVATKTVIASSAPRALSSLMHNLVFLANSFCVFIISSHDLNVSSKPLFGFSAFKYSSIFPICQVPELFVGWASFWSHSNLAWVNSLGRIRLVWRYCVEKIQWATWKQMVAIY